MKYLFNRLSVDDVQRLFDELERLLEQHTEWLDRVQRCLFCAEPPDPDDIAKDAHRRCFFGHWLESGHTPLLERFAEFRPLRQVHESMHRDARRLLLKMQQNHEVSRDEYAAFTHHATELRRLVIHIESTIKEGLSAASRLTAKVFESAAEAVVITDAKGTILNVNDAFVRVTGYSREEAIGQTPRLLKSGRHEQSFYATMWSNLLENGQWQGEIWNRRRDGEIYPEWLSITAVREDGSDLGNPSHYVAMFSDITAAKHNEERLYRLANYDSLTDLPNRGLFRENLAKALAWAARNRRKVAVLFLDLDRFKLINDTLGHNAGDALLLDVAHRLKGCVREADTVARMGGDEFTIVLTDLPDADSAATAARKILEVMAVPFTIEGRELFITTSIGISLYPRDGEHLEDLLKAADMAMYHAKEQGRDTYQFHRPDSREEIGQAFALENGLRRALEREEFRVFYQPQVDIETGAIVGMEALLRWLHPERGLLPPDEFIPIAEETGMINAIGRWVLEQACRQNKQWQASGAGQFRIAVNLSGRQLKQEDLPEQIADALRRSGLAPRWLQVELTETSVMQNPVTAGRLLEEIRNLGVSVAIDDFGSGYTSLSYLKRLPIDGVKIDKSFIAGVVDDMDDQAISKAIIALAESLRLKVVAEGVETHGQLAFLRENHCCDAQGYLFSRPLPANKLADILKAHTRWV